MLYGPIQREEKQRIEWWKNNRTRDYVLVSGHYHTVFMNENSIVLDPECGSPDGALGLYDVNNKVLKRFQLHLVKVLLFSIKITLVRFGLSAVLMPHFVLVSFQKKDNEMYVS